MYFVPYADEVHAYHGVHFGKAVTLMAIQQWSDNITVAELSDEPILSEDLLNMLDDYDSHPTHVVLNFATVGFVSSSAISKLLRLRKRIASQHKRLILGNVRSQTWGIFLTTGLDKVFEFTNDISTALASLQLGIATSHGE